jgi:hypothetical protein
MNGHNPDLSSYLQTPEGMAHTAVNDIMVRHQNERQTAIVHKFEFHYKGKARIVQVVAHSDVTGSEVEDRAGLAAKNWMLDMDEREHKRPPTEDERKQIGKAINEVYLNARKRRDSSSGRIYFNGIKGLN